MTPFPWDEVAKQADLAALKADLDVVKTDLAEVKSDVTTLKTDVTTLKTDVTTLKTDVTTLKRDVAANTATLVQLRGEFDGFRDATRTNFGSVFRKLDDLDMRFSDLTAVMNAGFSDIRAQMGGLRTDIRTVLLALVGFMLAVVLAGGTAAVTVLS